MLIKSAKTALKVMPGPLALVMTRALAAMTQRPAIALWEQEAMGQARKMFYGEGEKNVAWVWGEQGPLLILVHRCLCATLYLHRCAFASISSHTAHRKEVKPWKQCDRAIQKVYCRTV